jgi:hypothetical protein
MSILRALVASLVLGTALPAAADVWDVQFDHDNDQGTDNELIHGSIQLHDLGVLAGNQPDADWYTVGQQPKSSYELVVDGASGDVNDKGVEVQRLTQQGTAIVLTQTSVGISPGMEYARSLRWENTTADFVRTDFLRVRSSNCQTTCGPDDQYRVRFYETTVAIPRFNQSTAQTTVLLIQNPTSYDVTGHVYFWHASGTLEHTQPFSVGDHALYSLALGTIPILANKSGTITISHDARYGDLAGKAVALEPSTGFSFDSAMVWRPR